MGTIIKWLLVLMGAWLLFSLIVMGIGVTARYYPLVFFSASGALLLYSRTPMYRRAVERRTLFPGADPQGPFGRGQQEDEIMDPIKPGVKLTPEQIKKIKEQKGAIEKSKIPTIDKLYAELCEPIKGQDSAMRELARMVVARMVQAGGSKPVVVFIAGPTGTGKTESIKALAKILLGSEDKLARFDMGQYRDEHRVWELIGPASGYHMAEAGGKLPNAIRDRYGDQAILLLFDEGEKAHKSLFTQLIAFWDEGRVTDANGTVVAPKNTFVFITSNLEADKLESLGNEFRVRLESQDQNEATKARSELNSRARAVVAKSGFFPPEIIGRITRFLIYPSLTEDVQIALLWEFAREFASKDHRMEVAEITDQAVAVMLSMAAGAAYGGRGLKGVVEDCLSEHLTNLAFSQVTRIRVDANGEQIIVEPAAA